MVASGKGGTGKSTLSVYLGARLAAHGARVLLVELDSGLRSVDIIAGVCGKTVYDIEMCIRDSRVGAPPAGADGAPAALAARPRGARPQRRSREKARPGLPKARKTGGAACPAEKRDCLKETAWRWIAT